MGSGLRIKAVIEESVVDYTVDDDEYKVRN